MPATYFGPTGSTLAYMAHAWEPDDDKGVWQDDDPTTTGGWIYDLDAPRVQLDVRAVGHIKRLRANLQTWVNISGVPWQESPWEPVVCSLTTKFFVCLSVQQTTNPEGTNWEAINDVSFDNIASYGTTSLGWDDLTHNLDG